MQTLCRHHTVLVLALDEAKALFLREIFHGPLKVVVLSQVVFGSCFDATLNYIYIIYVHIYI